MVLAELKKHNGGPIRSLDCFEILAEIIGRQGSLSQVFKAREKTTSEFVALKKKLNSIERREELHKRTIREIKTLKKLDHPSVIKLKEIVTSVVVEGTEFDGDIYMVFEYMDYNLAALTLSDRQMFSVKSLMKQLLEGIYYCHTRDVIHCDIKGSNLLINNDGTLKIADFGLARSSDPDEILTNEFVPLGYRAPELLLGSEEYTTAVDMWSAGCVWADLIYGMPILEGETEDEQISKIFELCGSPDETDWPNVSELPLYEIYKPETPMKRRVRETFQNFRDDAVDLLDELLTLNPSKRMSAVRAKHAEYFFNDMPLLREPERLPEHESSHPSEAKKRQRQQVEEEEQKQDTPPSSPPRSPNGNGIRNHNLDGEAQVNEPERPNRPARGQGRGRGRRQGRGQRKRPKFRKLSDIM